MNGHPASCDAGPSCGRKNSQQLAGFHGLLSLQGQQWQCPHLQVQWREWRTRMRRRHCRLSLRLQEPMTGSRLPMPAPSSPWTPPMTSSCCTACRQAFLIPRFNCITDMQVTAVVTNSDISRRGVSRSPWSDTMDEVIVHCCFKSEAGEKVAHALTLHTAEAPSGSLAFMSEALALMQAEPLHGGQVVGSGRMWVNPIAEHDPRAVSINMKGQGLPFESMLLSYLPKVEPLSDGSQIRSRSFDRKVFSFPQFPCTSTSQILSRNFLGSWDGLVYSWHLACNANCAGCQALDTQDVASVRPRICRACTCRRLWSWGRAMCKAAWRAACWPQR